MGDPTARMLGRVTLNPMRHIDILGTLIWPAIYIFRSPLVLGWGKPVPITPNNFRRPEKDEMLVYAAGPVAHLAAAAVCLVVLLIVKHAIHGAAGRSRRPSTWRCGCRSRPMGCRACFRWCCSSTSAS